MHVHYQFLLRDSVSPFVVVRCIFSEQLVAVLVVMDRLGSLLVVVQVLVHSHLHIHLQQVDLLSVGAFVHFVDLNCVADGVVERTCDDRLPFVSDSI
jgi:hypothetical protein